MISCIPKYLPSLGPKIFLLGGDYKNAIQFPYLIILMAYLLLTLPTSKLVHCNCILIFNEKNINETFSEL